MTPPTDPPAGPRKPSLPRWVVFAVAAFGLAGCLFALPCAVRVRDSEGWVRSAVSLHSIGRAFHSYHEVNGRLPPAVVRDRDGRPLYSWRVLLLPYLEPDHIYRQFHLDEPWDSPHNKTLLGATPHCYVPALGGNDAPGLTRYQVFVGPGTAFERDGLTWDDFPDGLASTFLVVEAGEPVPWSKPADLAYAPNNSLPTLGGAFDKPVNVLCYEVGRRPGFNACFADGSVRFLRSTADERAVRALITRNGGEKVDPARLE